MSNTKNATTSGAVNLREGPGTNFKAITKLPAQTSLTILAEMRDWVQVSGPNFRGYVHKDYIALPTVATSGFFIHQSASKQWSLAPQRIVNAAADADSKSRQLAKIWNRFGGLLQRLSERLQIEIGAAAAVVAVESSGFGFVNNRMVIRFENHHFWRHWGINNPATFNKFFSFDQNEGWKNHAYRADPKLAWSSFHGSQDAEWMVFLKASTLNDEAAKKSISMGLPQILGSNCTLIGYRTAAEMFTAFQKDERTQIIGLFDFIKGSGATSVMLDALRQLDFVGFASRYNGTGQASQYGGLLRLHYELFKLL